MSTIQNFQFVTGNVTGEPSLRFLPKSGKPVVNFSVAQTPRYLDSETNTWVDGEVLYQSVSVIGDMAQNVADTLTKGMRVTVAGPVRLKSYTSKETGAEVKYTEIKADTVAVDLRFATAKVTKTAKNGGTQSDESE